MLCGGQRLQLLWLAWYHALPVNSLTMLGELLGPAEVAAVDQQEQRAKVSRSITSPQPPRLDNKPPVPMRQH